MPRNNILAHVVKLGKGLHPTNAQSTLFRRSNVTLTPKYHTLTPRKC